MWRVSGATNMHGETSGCLSIWFGKVMSERVHFKVLYFIALYTNQGARGDRRGYNSGRGPSIYSVIYYYIPMAEFGLKHIYLICDLRNDLFNDLMT